MNHPKRVDPDEAPAGYYAVSKDSFTSEARSANICRLCDWRPECQKITDKIEHYQRCSSDAIILHADGRLVQRHDGCSVVFLKRPVIIDSEEA